MSPPPGATSSVEAPDDHLILQRIRSHVIGPLGDDERAIGLRVDNGVVVLTGRVPEAMRTDLIKRIRSIEGVRQVEDQLSLA
jgi:osmotically-inducible protein OsmY